MTMQEKLEMEIKRTNYFMEQHEDFLDYYIQKMRTLLESDDNHRIGEWIMSYAKDIDNEYKLFLKMKHLLTTLNNCQGE